MKTRLKRPAEPFALAKLIGDIATGAVVDSQEDGKSEAAVRAGQKAGRVGGKSRAASLSPERKSEIATNAAQARWKASEARTDPAAT